MFSLFLAFFKPSSESSDLHTVFKLISHAYINPFLKKYKLILIGTSWPPSDTIIVNVAVQTAERGQY